MKRKGDVNYFGRIILLVSPHSRVSMGVDPPLSDPNTILVLYGVRRPATSYIKVPKQYLRYFFLVDPELEIFDFTRVRSDVGTYYVVRNGDERYAYLYLYDLFVLKFDLHMLVQIIGRWFMQSVQLLSVNYKYGSMRYNIRYYAVDVDVLVERAPYYYVVRKRERRYREFVEKLRKGEISIDEFRKWLLSSEDEDPFGVKVYIPLNDDVNLGIRLMFRGMKSVNERDEVLKKDYYSLRNVYNSLRYVRKQLCYRRLHEGDVWLLVRKIVVMLRGFEYCMSKGLEVPNGLKKFYFAYLSGVDRLLEELRRWLRIDDRTWIDIVRKLAFYYNVRVPLP